MQYRIVFALIMVGTMLLSCKNMGKLTRTKSRAEKNTSIENSSIQNKYGSILGVSADKISNITLYQFIDDWYGTPYKYGGQSRSGVDCSGFINTLYSQVYHKSIPRTTKDISSKVKSVSKSNLKEGDIVIFDIQGKKHSHAGVYLLNGKFVHASSSKGVIISDLENPYYVKAFSKAGRF